MNKARLLYDLWNSFGWDAYDELSVPTGKNKPELPYITYEVKTDDYGSEVALTASVWTRSTSWATAEKKADEIEEYISRGGRIIGNGSTNAWIKRSTPFRFRMGDDTDNSIKRIVINYTAEFFSAE